MPSGTLATLLIAAFFMPAVPVVALRWLRPPMTPLMVWTRLGHRSAAPILHDWVRYGAIAASMRLAAIGAEDAHFLAHSGFDWSSIRRALRHNRRGGSKRGGSTITQQVAKNLFLWPGRSYLRKAIEAYLTVIIEATWTKRRILEVYLNVAQFAPSVFGIAAAARVLIGKPASDLSRQEAALLAAVLPNPHRYDVRHPSPAVRLRQVMILDSMRRLGALDPDAI
jgi:monofunctional biosynthetic peptidoglycan transglycosylase